ncbi:hypothetical protein PFISCL1PPCAC_14964, partial [Pristionchus fissidentatus]
FSIASTTDSAIYDSMYNKFVSEFHYSPSELVYFFKGGSVYPDTRKKVYDAFMKDDKMRKKISRDKEAHQEVLHYLTRFSMDEMELRELDKYIVSTREFGSSYKQTFNIDELISRASRNCANSTLLHGNLNKILDDRELKQTQSTVNV